MGSSRYAMSRQKACQACVAAKAKCDRRAGRCSRCVSRDTFCDYPGAPRHTIKAGTMFVEQGMQTFSVEAEPPVMESSAPPPALLPALPPAQPPVAAADASTDTIFVVDPTLNVGDDLLRVEMGELLCPIRAEDISIRWMNAYVPTLNQTIKTYPPATIGFLHNTLKAYSGMVVRGRGLPPFVHPAQMAEGMSMQTSMTASTAVTSRGSQSAAALVTCIRLARICDTTIAGFSRTATDAAASIVKREMDRLYQAMQHAATAGVVVDHFASLAAFQAYLIYALVLFFQLELHGDPFLQQAIMALQEIASGTAKHGLVCVAEQTHTHPRWASWTVAEAKRRTLYVMYLFDSVLSAQDGMPSYLGTELRSLPAPSSKALWQATTLMEWNKAYIEHLNDWSSNAEFESGCAGLKIDELWAFPVFADAAGMMRRRLRIDSWLESVDEFGTMLYAITSSTHGS